MTGVRHLYVHLPFCVHRCGYCDFVTVVGRGSEHASYVEALLTELELEAGALAPRVDTIFLGGGTPTFTEPAALGALLGALPPAAEVTVEANPETVTRELAVLLRGAGVTRVSLGAQSFQPLLLAVLERRAGPDDVRRAVHTLRDVGFDNISLDLLYGIPGQSTSDLDADLAEALALAPEHLSYYELEAKPGTRFTHAHGDELARQAEAMEGYFERVVDALTGAGYRWYETASFCCESNGDSSGSSGNGPATGVGRDFRAQHNLGYWRARDFLGVGIGAVSTVGGRRWRNASSLHRYVDALGRGQRPPREVEPLDRATKARERLLLGLRLDEPLTLDEELDAVVDQDALARLASLGMIETASANGAGAAVRLTRRGRFLGGAVTAEVLA
jgi:coproporphyrinogen III oxidase-like Fe-S oxidoreductase